MHGWKKGPTTVPQTPAPAAGTSRITAKPGCGEDVRSMLAMGLPFFTMNSDDSSHSIMIHTWFWVGKMNFGLFWIMILAEKKTGVSWTPERAYGHIVVLLYGQ